MFSAAPICLLPLLLVAQTAWAAQVPISGRVVDETGAAIAGALVEMSAAEGGAPVRASSDLAGNFQLTLPAAGEYTVRAERLGFFLYQGRAQRFEEEAGGLVVTLNHLQEFSERVDVVYSPPAIDPAQPADRKELDNTEIQTVPYPAPQDYRNALPHDGRRGAGQRRPAAYQRRARPTRPITRWTASTSPTRSPACWKRASTSTAFSPWTSRPAGSPPRTAAAPPGVLDAEDQDGRRPLALRRHQFHSRDLERWRLAHQQMDAAPGAFRAASPKAAPGSITARTCFTTTTPCPGCRAAQNRTSGVTASDLSRFQVNLTPANILTGSFFFNLADTKRAGLSILDPAKPPPTTARRCT